MPPALPVVTPALEARDADQLRLLSIFHYVLGGFTALFSLFPIVHLLMGLAIVTGALPMDEAGQSSGNEPFDPRLLGWLFVVIAALMIAAGLTLAALMVVAGRCLVARRRHLLCLVVAGLTCMLVPLGTVLGVFTLVLLNKPQVKAAFDGNGAAA
ncbi:MAG: hypothetical protein GAK43_00068 [Stenotrophomonas maltophilia]|nr:MAG: hypothetical protein GAK43_00068 [Stenotrophomonas maltophilia]